MNQDMDVAAEGSNAWERRKPKYAANGQGDARRQEHVKSNCHPALDDEDVFQTIEQRVCSHSLPSPSSPIDFFRGLIAKVVRGLQFHRLYRRIIEDPESLELERAQACNAYVESPQSRSPLLDEGREILIPT
jgi:hypothetical protein